MLSKEKYILQKMSESIQGYMDGNNEFTVSFLSELKTQVEDWAAEHEEHSQNDLVTTNV